MAVIHRTVPLTYRGAAPAGAEDGLVGTLMHGTLGRRWVYDGAHDPVLVEQLLALLAGRTTAQDQNESDTADPTVEVRAGLRGVPAPLAGPGKVSDTADATVIGVGAAGQPGPLHGLTLTRVLRPVPPPQTVSGGRCWPGGPPRTAPRSAGCSRS
ncbi:maltokinase N-terminal cap-like domain-containing protein [Streptomyces avidinii]